MKKTTLMRNIELRKGAELEELIRDQSRAGRTLQEIADDMGISYHTLRSWLPILGMHCQRFVVVD